jgi:hypothetical protein
MKKSKSIMEHMKSRNSMQQPKPELKSQTLKGNSAGFSMTRQQFRDKALEKYGPGSKYNEAIKNDQEERSYKNSNVSKDAGRIGMKDKDIYSYSGSETEQIGKAINKAAKSQKGKKMAPQYDSPLKSQTLKGAMKKTR